MKRTGVIELRDAVVDDAADLATLWADYLPRSMSPVDDMRLIIKRNDEGTSDRIVVATYGGSSPGRSISRSRRSPRSIRNRC
ncbi:hypothetical protein [Nocardioides alcanivorans]|uniref:hypothetical protein n=1 Tax=Nocardioides alcanivorans TaxID=2897352 RepID=UPI001F1E3F7A|nr:hypothetical protein [Nocardioides alcanivorans]